MKNEFYRKPKLKKSILIIPFLALVICILFKQTYFSISKEIQTVISQEVENMADSIVVEEYIRKELIEPSEDLEIKSLIENIQIEKNLNESNFGFFYYNLNEQKYYFYNGDAYFTAASTIKVPIAMYYYDEINSGNITGETKLLYTSGCYEAGNGTTASTYSVGESVPLNFLLRQSIINSDNTAVNILIRNLGQKQYRYNITKYTNNELPETFYTNNIISVSYAYDVINYLYEHIDNYQELIENMKQSSMGQYLKKYIENYEVAHKYGSYNGYVHDYGIVFGEDTYLIGIFTKNVTSSDELIANINLQVLNYTLENNAFHL